DALAFFYTINIGKPLNQYLCPYIQESTIANSFKCDIEIKASEAPEIHNDLVWSITNRKQEYQKTNNKVMIHHRDARYQSELMQ
ncbi:13517_t:CDS:2, partial [Funneliformis geosporum]